MKCTLLKKIKVFFIVALALIVLGFTMFGIFGFNQTVDYRASYEVQVSVDQKAGNTTAVLEQSANDYFADKGIKVLNYATQKMSDGMVVVYKFNSDISADVAGLKDYIQAQLDENSTIENVSADVVVNESLGNSVSSLASFLIALGVAIVLIFVYSLITTKFAGAVATIFASILSGVMFVAFMGLVRIPSAPFIAFGCGISIILSGMLSVALASKYKAFAKAYDKATKTEIVETVFSKSWINYIIITALFVLATLALCAFIMPYPIFVGAQLLVAGICGISSAMFATPFMWSIIKKSN